MRVCRVGRACHVLPLPCSRPAPPVQVRQTPAWMPIGRLALVYCTRRGARTYTSGFPPPPPLSVYCRERKGVRLPHGASEHVASGGRLSDGSFGGAAKTVQAAMRRCLLFKERRVCGQACPLALASLSLLPLRAPSCLFLICLVCERSASSQTPGQLRPPRQLTLPLPFSRQSQTPERARTTERSTQHTRIKVSPTLQPLSSPPPRQPPSSPFVTEQLAARGAVELPPVTVSLSPALISATVDQSLASRPRDSRVPTA